MSNTVTVVTSFSEEGWEKYAKDMVESAAEYWEDSIKLIAYYHDFNLEEKSPPIKSNIEYRNLNHIKDMIDFRKEYDGYDGTLAGKTKYNWRFDVIKFCHKVFALSDCAFTLCENTENPGWLVWLDADTITTKPLSKDNLMVSLPDGVDLVHLGRMHHAYSETSFVGFNLNSQPPVDLLGDLLGAYISGEIIQYREWHDGFVFERLLTIYKAHGMKYHDWTGSNATLSTDMTAGVQAFELFPLGSYITHMKGDRKDIDKVSPDVKGPARYKQLLNMIKFYKPKTIIETGTWNGGRAIDMALIAFEYTDEIHYTGYDLFEDATTELDKKELNGKPHNHIEAVYARLEEFQTAMASQDKTFKFVLIKGDTKKTLQESYADLCFIDGGHSEDTVNHDYAMLKESKVIVFDDYVSKDPEGNNAGEEFLGVNHIIKNYEGRKFVLPSSDRIVEGGITHLAVILNDETLPEIPNDISAVPIVVQPRDCMPKEDIMGNVKENTKLISTWVNKARPHNETAIIVSGGPSTDWEELKDTIRMEGEENCKVVCVKHSYPNLLKNKIVPWACIILDPRPIGGVSTHGVVRKSLFKTIHKDTIFMPASMTDPSITKLIQRKTKNVIGWHAFTQSLQENIKDAVKNGAVKVDEELGIDEGATMIVGGTCAAMRSVGLMHTLGFRNFHLFGYDCSTLEPSEEEKKELTDEDKPKYIKVSVGDKNFWTTGELIAMGQDCERLFEKEDVDMRINFHGKDTMAASLWELAPIHKLQHYTELLNI